MNDMDEVLNELVRMIRDRMPEDGHFLIAVDGRCASGKTTLAEMLKERTGASLVHMDDFFLRPEQRTKERYETPGENVDHERFLKEVLIPLAHRETAVFHPFDCNTMRLSEETKEADGKGLAIVEGSYSCHPLLRDYYDFRVFVHADREKQLERIAKRNPEKTEDFMNKWIPFEEMYFEKYDVRNRADYVINTTNLF